MPPSVCPRRAVPPKIMCTVQWASNLHLLPQFTFLSTFFFFQTPVFAQSCQALAEGKAWESRLYILNLTPFFASRPKTDKHFLQPPDWGCRVLTQKGVGLCGCVSLQLPGCPRPDEERKGIVGTRGRHKKLIEVKGLPSHLFRSQGRAVWATPSSRGSEMAPLRLSDQGPGVRVGFAFSSPRKEDSRPSSNLEKKQGGS